MVSFRSQLQNFTILAVFWIIHSAYSHTVPWFSSLHKQLNKRSSNPIDVIYDNLSLTDQDFIAYHLSNLTSFNGTKCDACKHKIIYSQTLLNEVPNKSHLVSLLLFQYCLSENSYKESKCDNIDFFVTTRAQDIEFAANEYNSGYTGASSINFYDNDFIHMLKNFNTSSDLDLEYYCYYKADACDLPETPEVYKKFNLESWWPEKQPQHNSQPEYTNNSDVFNVLHITDFHLQLRYQVTSESNCSQSLCCMPESYNSDLPTNGYNFTEYYKNIDPELKCINYSFYPDAYYDETNNYIKGDYYDFPKERGFNYNSAPATVFGAYLCDSPEILLNNTLKYISMAHSNKSFEFTVFTGDLVDHDVIHCDASTTKEAEIKSFKLMKEYLGNMPVFPSLGNHDTFPYGQISPMQYDFNNSYEWNADLISDLLVSNGWLPYSEKSFIKNHYAGFSYVTNRNLKIISLNSNCYYQKNLWAYINLGEEPDLFGQWKFLVDELIESEQQGQRVWIMAHIPSGDSDALPIQSRIFGEIVKRFSPYTIANIFYGHTHRDQFRILYSSNSSSDAQEIINMAWISQSVTPLTDNNPSWRYYEVENESFNIINSYNYYTRLNETFVNGGDEPEWDFEYSARDTFDPKGQWPERSPLNATFWDKFVVQDIKNQSNVELNQLYSNIQYRWSPFVPNCTNETTVSDTCFNENYCIVSNFFSDDYINCLKD